VTTDLHNPKKFTKSLFSTAKLQININFINTARMKYLMNVLKKMYFSITLWKVSDLSISDRKNLALIFIPFDLVFLQVMHFSSSSYTVISYNYFIRN